YQRFMDVFTCFTSRLYSFSSFFFSFFFFNDTSTTDIYTLSLHDALPIFSSRNNVLPSASSNRPTRSERASVNAPFTMRVRIALRSEEHTSELQSHLNLVCRLLLEKKKKNI